MRIRNESRYSVDSEFQGQKTVRYIWYFAEFAIHLLLSTRGFICHKWYVLFIFMNSIY